MFISEEKLMQILAGLIQEAALTVKVESVVYREDYQDYLAVVGRVHYTTIREKLVKDYVETKDSDFRNEIIFKLKHPVELDEFQKAELGIEDGEGIADKQAEAQRQKDGKGGAMTPGETQGQGKKKIEVDDSDKLDWI